MNHSLSSSRVSVSYIYSLPQITEHNYHELQAMLKILKDHKNNCLKNREYLEAQKATDKLQQITRYIQKRNSEEVDSKMNQNKLRIIDKHEAERQKLFEKYEAKFQEMQNRYSLLNEKRRRFHEEQKAKLQEQAAIALSLSFSPSDKLKELRKQQRKLVEKGDFLGAQRVKQQMQRKESELSEKHHKLRDANIKSMIRQIQNRYEKESKERDAEMRIENDDLLDERKYKMKQMKQRHEKQLRENRWVYDHAKKN